MKNGVYPDQLTLQVSIIQDINHTSCYNYSHDIIVTCRYPQLTRNAAYLQRGQQLKTFVCCHMQLLVQLFLTADRDVYLLNVHDADYLCIVWIQIRPDKMPGLICFQTVWNSNVELFLQRFFLFCESLSYKKIYRGQKEKYDKIRPFIYC